MNESMDESKQEKIVGVFSKQEASEVGTGTTVSKAIQKTYWYCEEIVDGPTAGKFSIQPLNRNYIPSGIVTTIGREVFLDTFFPEPEFYMSNVYPQMRTLQKTLAKAERHRATKELYTAEMEYGKAIVLDEQNVRANFGLGLVYMERGDKAKAKDIFQRLVQLDAAFKTEHKHLFNEFGMQLRKNKLFEEAKQYYEKATLITQNDEKLFYNMARACFEKQEMEGAIINLLKCLALNPVHETGVSFLMGLQRNDLVPQNFQERVAKAMQIARDLTATDILAEQIQKDVSLADGKGIDYDE